MKVTQESQGAAAVFIVEGQVDLHTSPELRSHLRTALTNRANPLVVDLKAVSFIDSSGLATLIEALKSVGSYGGKLRLCGLNSDVRRLFDLARLNEVFDLRESRSDAMTP
jgi:anti-sigma B factor antagonist